MEVSHITKLKNITKLLGYNSQVIAEKILRVSESSISRIIHWIL